MERDETCLLFHFTVFLHDKKITMEFIQHIAQNGINNAIYIQMTLYVDI